MSGSGISVPESCLPCHLRENSRGLKGGTGVQQQEQATTTASQPNEEFFPKHRLSFGHSVKLEDEDEDEDEPPLPPPPHFSPAVAAYILDNTTSPPPIPSASPSLSPTGPLDSLRSSSCSDDASRSSLLSSPSTSPHFPAVGTHMVRFELPGSCPERPLHFRLRLLEDDEEGEQRKHNTPEVHNEHHSDDELVGPSHIIPSSLLAATAARPRTRRRRFYTTNTEMRADHFRAANARRIRIHIRTTTADADAGAGAA